jgi:hypothetical protein
LRCGRETGKANLAALPRIVGYLCGICRLSESGEPQGVYCEPSPGAKGSVRAAQQVSLVVRAKWSEEHGLHGCVILRNYLAGNLLAKVVRDLQEP